MKNIIKKADIPDVKLSKKPLSLTFPSTGYGDMSKSNCKVNINWLTPHCCLIWFICRVFIQGKKHLRIKYLWFTILFAKIFPAKIKNMLLWKTLWILWKTLRFSKKTCKNWRWFAKVWSAKQCFWVSE